MKFEAMDQYQYAFRAKLFPRHVPADEIYVHDSIYFLKSYKVKYWFNNNLKSHVKVDSWAMCNASSNHECYEQSCDANGNISCPLSKQGFVEV